MSGRLRVLGRWVVLPSVLLMLVGAAFHSALDNDFHFDDEESITRHGPVRIQRLTGAALWRAASESFIPTRPLPSATFAVDWWRGNGSPGPFQWTNLCLHAANSLLVLGLFVLVMRTVLGVSAMAIWPSFFGAALWSVHPIQVQAVTYVVQRMAELSALGTIGAVGCYLLARRPNGSRLWFVMAGFFALIGILSKENAWVTPVLILLAEYTVVRHGQKLFQRRSDFAVMGFFGAAAAYLVFDLLAHGMVTRWAEVYTGYDGRGFSLKERLLTQPRVILFHFSQLLWPLPGRFSPEHDFELSRHLLQPLSTIFALLAAVFWLGVGVALALKRNARAIGFFMLWVPCTLVIESTVIPLEMVFEHRMYLPLVGVFGLISLAAAYVMSRWWSRSGWVRLAGSLLFASVLAGLIASTNKVVPNWRNSLSLYRTAVAHAPGSSRAWGNYGVALLKAGETAEARSALERAIALNSADTKVVENYAVLLMDEGELVKARSLLHGLLRTDRVEPSVYNHLGELALKSGDYASALGWFYRARDAYPWNPVYYWNIAYTHERRGECREALANWNEYLTIQHRAEDRVIVSEHILESYHQPGGSCYPSQR